MAASQLFGLENVDPNIWPQRLLRIKDMTSYELRLDGNDAYYRKKDKNPKYGIISYTWGRFRGDGEWGSPVNPKAEAITIKGITWKIPAIDPVKGFSSNKFKNVLQTVAGNYDYVWVDVACINQGPTPDKYNQIGCQAAIFNKASASYIWLHQQGLKDGITIAARINAFVDSIESDAVDRSQMTHAEKYAAIAPRQQAETLVCGLLYDPWFSSLWTLQESFLRKDATILSRTGEKTPVMWQGKQTDLTLYVLLDICRAYLSLQAPNTHIITPINEAGLGSIIAQNPLILLRAARHRTSIKMNDRILGIQQIFGVDVGPTEGRQQVEIERKLSLVINQRSPPLAQTFLRPYEYTDGRPYWQAHLGTFTKPRVYSSDPAPVTSDPTPYRQTRKGRFSGTKAGIEDTMFVPHDFFDAQEIPCPLRAQMSEDPTRNLRWTGYSFPVESLWNAWQQYEMDRMPPGLGQGQGSSSVIYIEEDKLPSQNSFTCSLYLDAGSWVSTPQQLVNVLPVESSGFSQPLGIVYQLCKSRPRQVKVLILGKIQSKTAEGVVEAWTGLLVKQGGNQMWERIGFCTWKYDMNDAAQDSCLLG